MDWGVSQRRACATLDVNRSTCQYRSRRPGQAPLEARIKEARPECATAIGACTSIFFGYRSLRNGFYRSGFATTQVAYEEAFRDVFAMLR